MSILLKTVPISTESLLKAISLKCAMCYGAMAFINSIGGFQDDPWILCHKYTLKNLLEEADQLNLDLTNLKSAVDNAPVCDTLYYKRARGLISEEEYRKEFYKWKNGK